MFLPMQHERWKTHAHQRATTETSRILISCVPFQNGGGGGGGCGGGGGWGGGVEFAPGGGGANSFL